MEVRSSLYPPVRHCARFCTPCAARPFYGLSPLAAGMGPPVDFVGRLGPGLLESAYEASLAYELESRGLRVVRQQAVPIVYHGTRIEMGFRADLIVEDLAIVEIKSVEAVAPVHKKQLVALIKDGITRIANGMPD